MRHHYFLNTDVLSIADLEARWPGVTADIITSIIIGNYIEPYISVANEINPDGEKLNVCVSISGELGFGTTVSISDNWNSIVFSSQDVDRFENERPDFKRNHIIKLHNLDGYRDSPSGYHPDHNKIHEHIATNMENTTTNFSHRSFENKHTEEIELTITIQKEMYIGKTAPKVRDIMQTQGFDDAVIAYVLRNFMNKDLTTIGRLIRGQQKGGEDRAESTYLRHAHKLLAEAALLRIVRD